LELNILKLRTKSSIRSGSKLGCDYFLQ